MYELSKLVIVKGIMVFPNYPGKEVKHLCMSTHSIMNCSKCVKLMKDTA